MIMFAAIQAADKKPLYWHIADLSGSNQSVAMIGNPWIPLGGFPVFRKSLL
jgi:hypothetical protein